MITVLICTVYNRVSRIKRSQFQMVDNINYVISCQGIPEFNTDYYINKLESVFGKGNAEFIFSEGYGLSRNRNIGLNNIINEKHNYVYIADDDITIEPNGLINCCNIAEKYGLDLVTGKY
ncbi:hypothetical protein P4S63_13890 [Pseudoalteromonas sp. B193]